VKKLSPTVEEIEELRITAPKGPVVMINLLKFRSDNGRAAYRRYLEVAWRAVAELESGGAPPLKNLYSGRAGKDVADGEDWDFVIVMEYADFDHFASLMLHPIYQSEAVPLRKEALEKALFMMSSPAPISDI